MTREERFKMDMIDEFKLMCEIVGNNGRIIVNKHRMLKALEQEPFINKPCISEKACEHDKEVVLGKIRAEIKALSPEPTAYDVVDGNPVKDAVWETIADVLQIIDKYKAESEG